MFNYGMLLFATGEKIKIEDYSYKDGLTSSIVYSVFKDSKGFLWICSDNGLFRFDGYNFRNINTLVKDFLNEETYCIEEDHVNNFYIGTNRGIYYYNTHTEQLFLLKLSLGKTIKIHQILLLDNKIWVASDNGLLVFDIQKNLNPKNTIQTLQLFPDKYHKRTPQDNVVNTIFYLPGNQSLWVGSNGALYELNRKTLDFRHIDSHFQNSIRGISAYRNKIIVSSWDGGVFIVDPLKHMLDHNPFVDEVNKVVGNIRVMTAIFDKQNRLWVATFNSGLYIFENRNGKVTYSNYRNNPKHEENLKSDFINKMYIDNTGIVWLCMNQPALSKVYFQQSKLKSFNFSDQKNNLISKEIIEVTRSSNKNKLWVTTNGSGIYLFDAINHSYVQYTDKTSNGLQLQSNDINLCYQDKKGNLWIVYQKLGLYVVPAKSAIGLVNGISVPTIKPVSANNLASMNSAANSYITTFFEDNSGRLWIGAWGSLYVIDFKTNSKNNKEITDFISEIKSTCVFAIGMRANFDFFISPVTCINEIENNRYWIGAQGSGIIQVDEISETKFSCKQLPQTKKIPSTNIGTILKDNRNGVWIGTHSGLCYLNLKNDSVKILTVKNGLPSDNINNIVEDTHFNIWISTSYGISKIRPKDYSISNYFYSDKEKFNQYIKNGGELTDRGIVFSTNESLVIINPDSIDNQGNSPSLYFTDIKIDNKPVFPLEKYKGTSVIETNINETKIINVPYNQTLSIEFAALDFLAPHQIRYQYRIGNNNEWILLKPGQRNLSLPNMSQGEYTLSIMAINSSSKSNVISVKINYLPPFWLSKPAYVLYVAIILFLFLTYRRLLIQRLLQKSIIEKERFEIKKLEELDKMKSEFFSNISHEFRTPLSLIIGPLEKLVNEVDISSKNKEKIRLVLKSSSRLLKLTNEFMDFSKIEKKLLTPEYQMCEFKSFVNEICLQFNNLADSSNLDFNISCSFEQQEIPLDKRMIEKVIYNLLSNAFKYTPANGLIMVNITKIKEQADDYIKLSVINTGEGINTENLDKIFNRYYQVNNVQNRNVEGTGIGLSLVKSYIDLHNGKVEVKSKTNQETSFDIYLPVQQVKFDAKAAQLSKINDISPVKIIENKEIKTQNSKPTSHYQLLIIEDDDDIRNYIIDELSCDFKILSAKNGQEGLKIANEILPDLVITDLVMPVLSGLELCKELKTSLVTSHIPILMLSAITTIEEQIEGLEMGADVYMVKPFSIEHLKAQILRLISFKQAIYSQYLKETELIPKGSLNTRLDEEYMRKVTNFIENNLTNSDLCVDQLAQCVSLSKVQTYRKIKAITGMSIVEFIRTIRLKKSIQLIMEGQHNFSEIAFETGFSTPSYFSKCFHDHFGKTPSEFAAEFGDTKTT
jgi:signal transduction histidine kinase/ligand-binding sensor domain-containing protein/DNA-binding response OmpR family regulator